MSSVGRIKLLGPNTSRQPTPVMSPVKAGDMAFCPFPLFDENDSKQGSHGKVNACGVKGDEAAGKGAKGSTNEPVTVVENV